MSTLASVASVLSSDVAGGMLTIQNNTPVSSLGTKAVDVVIIIAASATMLAATTPNAVIL